MSPKKNGGTVRSVLIGNIGDQSFEDVPCGDCTWTVMNVGVNYHPNHIYMETLNNAMKTLVVFIYKVTLYCIRLYKIMNLESFFRRLDCITGWRWGWLYILLIRFTGITTPFKMSIWQLVWNKLRCWNSIFSQFSFSPQRYFLNINWVLVQNAWVGWRNHNLPVV